MSDAPKLSLLLVMPRLVQTVGDGYAFPLGIAYVSSSLKAAGFHVETLNLNHVEGTVGEILGETISRHQIDVVATGGLSFQYATLYDIVEQVKRINSDVMTIVGGGLMTAEPTVALEALEHADFGVIGEAEITMCELIATLEQDRDPSTVKGICFKREERVVCTPPRKPLTELDTLAWPDFEGFDFHQYLETPASSVNNLLAHRMAYVCGSRSCPYNCTFCFHTTGRRYRQRSVDAIIAEISYLKDSYQIGFVCMSDELFAKNRDRIRDFSEKMRDLELPWSGSFRVDDVDEDLIEILRNGTCSSMSFGLESADNRVLESMGKKITVDQIENALRLTYEAGIPSAGNFIFGDIAETRETAMNTINWWIKNNHYNIGLNLISTYPGSKIYEHACENGIISDRIKFLKDGCPQVNISQMSDSDYGSVVKDLFSLPYKLGKQVKEFTRFKVTSNGRVDIVGICSDCGSENEWFDIKLFVGNSWLPCSVCGQKHYVPLPGEFKKHICDNLIQLYSDEDYVALWGVTYYSIALFESTNVIDDERFIIVDNASAKQMIYIKDNQVYDPSIIIDKGISIVISFYPNSIQQIRSLSLQKYPSVTQVVDVCDLATSFELGDSRIHDRRFSTQQ